MYICDVHGKLEQGWCNDCKKIVNCNCSITKTKRFKDLKYGCQEGERTITIWITYCPTCGQYFSVDS
jgi:hypothetical protein